MAVALFRDIRGGSPRRCIDILFTICSLAAMGHLEDDLPFRVEQWDAAGARLEQTLSASADLKLGRAAFAEGRPSATGAAHRATAQDAGHR